MTPNPRAAAIESMERGRDAIAGAYPAPELATSAPRVVVKLFAYVDREPRIIGEPQPYPASLTELASLLTAAAWILWPGEPFQIRGRPGELFPLAAVRAGQAIRIDVAPQRCGA